MAAGGNFSDTTTAKVIGKQTGKLPPRSRRCQALSPSKFQSNGYGGTLRRPSAAAVVIHYIWDTAHVAVLPSGGGGTNARSVLH